MARTQVVTYRGFAARLAEPGDWLLTFTRARCSRASWGCRSTPDLAI
ncbi:hypothetical protein [Actinophytocola sediminis]